MTNKERMSKIGELQDELAKLGFKHITNHLETMEHKYFFVKVHFTLGAVFFFKFDELLPVNPNLDYTSPTWQEDVLNKVKELIKMF